MDGISDFDFYGTHFKSHASFSGELRDNIFNSAQFDTYGNFTNAKISGGAFFIRSAFNKGNFSESVIQGIARFNEARFNEVVLKNTLFQRNAFFRKASFLGKADFLNTTFSYNVDFNGAMFKSLGNFSNSTIYDNAIFKNVTFEKGVDFDRAFLGKADFSSSRLNGTGNFGYCFFDESPNFINTLLPDTLVLLGARLSSDAILDLSLAAPKGKRSCLIDLRKFPIDKIKLRWEDFNLLLPNKTKKLGKSDTTYYSFQEARGVFGDLLKRFSDLGYSSSYEKCDKEYRQFLYHNDPKYAKIGPFLNFVDKYWWGYGYDLERIVLNSIIILILFTFANYFQFEFLIESVYPIKKIQDAYLVDSKSKFRLAFIYSAFIFFGVSIKIDLLDFTKFWQSIWILFQFITGLICLAFVVNHILS